MKSKEDLWRITLLCDLVIYAIIFSQGLGKTVSTIALILKERAPSHRADGVVVKKEECETLNLDDDDGVTEIDRMKKGADGSQVTSNHNSTKSLNSSGQSKGRPAAGTLIVCPTSVLPQ